MRFPTGNNSNHILLRKSIAQFERMISIMQQARIIGIITSAVLDALGEEGQLYKVGDIIYLGESNVNHIKRRHSSDYTKYGDRLSQIILDPDYVGINEEDDSLEYVKVFDNHVKVVVRVAGDDRLYIRSLYTVYQSRTEFFIKTGRLKPLTKMVE